MNTKGIKFLAVLAVMVMAFAAIVALAPADNDTVAIEVFGNKNVVVDPAVIDEKVKASEFYISEDATVKIKDMEGISADEVIFYVQNGVELELDFKQAAPTTGLTPTVAKTIIVYTVTADQQRTTTSTVDKGKAGGEDGTVDGKIVLKDTKFQFTGADKQNVVYKAMMPSSVKTTTTSGLSFKTAVTTDGSLGNYALISVSEKLTSAAEAGPYVAVAYGQSLESSATIAGLKYGVLLAIEDEDSNATAKPLTYTYYALGMNAGTVTLETTQEYVDVINGSVIVNNSGASVKMSSAVSLYGDVKVSFVEKGALKVVGTLDLGTMSVSGKTQFDLVDNATVTLNSSADVTGKITVDGELILKNDYDKSHTLTVDGDGMIIAENEKLWYYSTTTNKPAIVLDAGDFKGQYDVRAINKTAEVKDAFAENKIEKNQTYRMVGDTIVANQFTVEGVLYIEPGVTLTITQTNNYGASIKVQGQYAQIINEGTIIIKTTKPFTQGQVPQIAGLHVYGGCVINEGTITASSQSEAATAEGGRYDTFVVNFNFYEDQNAAYPEDVSYGGYGFVNEGTISIGKNDTASLDDHFTNAGNVSVSGALKANALVNGGIFTVNNAKIIDASKKFTVTNGFGATFKIVSAEVAPEMEITVQNGYNYDETAPAYANSIVITAPEAQASTPATDVVRITGITINDASTLTTSKLDLSGTIGASIPDSFDPSSTEKAKVTLGMKGAIKVSETATIAGSYKLDFSATATLDVPGALVISKDAKLSGDAKLTMTVDGIVTDVDSILKGNNFKYIAAKFTYLTGNTTVYTNLADAIDMAAAADVAQIDVGGDASKFITVKKDLTIPEGITVDGKYLEVDKKAEITVQSGARFSFDKIVIQDGLIRATDVNDIDFNEIVADVKEEDEDSTAAVCMSLEVAISYASAGDVIKLANSFYTANADFVIPEGITVDATAVEGTEFVLVNSDLTVDGKLFVDQFAFVATTDDTIGITVNGFIYDKCSDGACFVKWWYNPFGVSYPWTDEQDHTWFIITTIENIQPAINEADDAVVTVHGDAKLDELNVHGRDDVPATVNFTGDVEIGVINIDDTTLNFADGKKVTACVRDAVGSITIIGAYSDDDLSIYSMDDEGVYMDGTVIDTPDKETVTSVNTYSITFEGITGIDGTGRTAIDWTNKEKTPLVLFAGETTVIGKKAKINTDDENITGIVTITGVVYVDNASKLAINSDVQVTGALVAADRTEGDLGVINTAGNIFIGMLVSDLYDLDYYYAPALADAAAVSGKVSLAEGCFIFVAPAALVDPEIVEDLDSMGVFIDDELWFTLYGYENDDFSLTGLCVPSFNAEIYSIIDEFDEDIAYALDPEKVDVIALSEFRTISEFGNVYITLDYDIFEVKIKTDGSVKAVYIDGILMETGNVANIFTMKNVAAGTHKVTVEAATGYDADKCVLYTELGTILPGMAFTFTEYDVTEYDREGEGEFAEIIPVVVYNINGTEIQPEPVPPTPEEESQWTITTILLVILVVLIAIMAVIVALRLNRS